MDVTDFVVIGLLLVNLGFLLYAGLRAQAGFAVSLVRVLGEKEGELIVLRQTVEAARQVIARLQAKVREAQAKVGEGVADSGEV